MTRPPRTPPQPRRRHRRRRWIAALISAGILLACVGVSHTPSTDASWSQPNYHNATLSSGKVYPVTSVTCSAASGLIATSIVINWTQPVTTGNGLVPTSYTLSWSGNAGTGQTTVAGLSGNVTSSTLSIAGTATIVVYANYGTWQSAISTQTRTVTTISALGVIVSWTCA